MDETFGINCVVRFIIIYWMKIISESLGDWLNLAPKEFCFRYFVSATAVSLGKERKKSLKPRGTLGKLNHTFVAVI